MFVLQYFQAIQRGELSTLEDTLSSLVQPAAVCATNECVQTAQLACCENLTHENLTRENFGKTFYSDFMKILPHKKPRYMVFHEN